MSFVELQVENFTVSFSDGRALCYLLHYYHPSLLKLEDICTKTTLTYEGQGHRDEKSLVDSDFDDSFSANWTTSFQSSKFKNC